MKIVALITLASLAVGCVSRGIELQWTNTETKPIVVEIWSSTDLKNWHLKDTVSTAQTNYVFRTTNSQEYFKIRNADPRNGFYSQWAK